MRLNKYLGHSRRCQAYFLFGTLVGYALGCFLKVFHFRACLRAPYNKIADDLNRLRSLYSNGTIQFLDFVGTNFNTQEERTEKNITESRDTGTHKKLLLVGVMTTADNLNTRARAIYETWGNKVLGELLFFIGNPNKPLNTSLPVVVLTDVPEKYPPQRKVFRMLQYFYTHNIDEFHFFLRSDDDMYADNARLRNFLCSLNASAVHYIGQSGMGIVKERHKLGLKRPYCKGGPGIVFSNAAIKGLYSGLDQCFADVVSKHEDTEVGRCVDANLDVRCAEPDALRRYFFERYGRDMRKMEPSLAAAVTVHSQKETSNMYRLHHFMLLMRIKLLKAGILLVERDIYKMDINL